VLLANFFLERRPFSYGNASRVTVLLDSIWRCSSLEGLNACLDHRTTVYIPNYLKFLLVIELSMCLLLNPKLKEVAIKDFPKFPESIYQVYVRGLLAKMI
jgi:midasin (ATPase involved in ribosome maturation)